MPFYEMRSKVLAGKTLHEVEWPARHDRGGYVECALSFYQVGGDVWVRGWNDQDEEFVAKLADAPTKYDQRVPGHDEFLGPDDDVFVSQLVEEICGVAVDADSYECK